MKHFKTYQKSLQSVCTQNNFSLICLGEADELPIYNIVLNPSAKKTVVFSAGIHGDEIAGPWAVIDFLKQYTEKKYSHVKIFLFPIVNPTGFNANTRTNYLKKDLNRHFTYKKLTREQQIVYKSLKSEKIKFFHALHEDNSERKFYTYIFEKKKEKIYRHIITNAKRTFPIQKDKKIYDDPAIDGLIINAYDGSFEDRMFQDGVPYSMCTETPGKQSLKKKIVLNVKIMNIVLRFVEKS